ncbi:NADH dehydrogenase [ubiquinone] 1 alpha subcomplex subunit 12 [Nematolebias whitei]|uniref:NADH dehydrogenase [ubiquinone] 1 alpha subcomplex subunit 12 n=1 Tax=Nematolebias whitei TaxID=451745 RepID=UPI0018990F2C|nr:NADH dehydrogenase [ubiquinone] 1 alpha subcomplex subunit 12 [Nematolebias whitei]
MAAVVKLIRRVFGGGQGGGGGHGGLRGFINPMFKENDNKPGTFVGEDKYGNKYFENKRKFFGRHRWVVYTKEMNGKDTTWDVDPSMVTPEWHRWLHSITDLPPSSHPLETQKFLAKIHQLNSTGTPQQYVPYSTTRKKIQEWVPPKAGAQ